MRWGGDEVCRVMSDAAMRENGVSPTNDHGNWDGDHEVTVTLGEAIDVRCLNLSRFRQTRQVMTDDLMSDE